MSGFESVTSRQNLGFVGIMPVCENNYIINNVTWYDNFLKTRAKDGISWLSEIGNRKNNLLYLKEELYVRVSS